MPCLLAEPIAHNQEDCLPDAMELPERIEQSRRKAGFSQARLALAVGTQQNSVHRWEKGEYKPALDQALRLAEVCNVDLVWLLTGKEVAPSITEDEQQIIDLVRALRLDKSEALRRIATPGISLPPTLGIEGARAVRKDSEAG